jgi:predicted DNA binding CopG/RHH family protein
VTPPPTHEDVVLRLPKDLLERMRETARIEGISLSKLIVEVFE